LLDESIEAWVEKIKQSQILVFSGGFSAGDEPDGSAKFIVNVLKNEKMKNAVHELLSRDGMILGICNGFQALVKSGLLPYGEIRDLDETSPTLAHNAIGRHISQMVDVKVINDDSPWLKGMKGEVYTIPISHGEGRFMASEEVLARFIKKVRLLHNILILMEILLTECHLILINRCSELKELQVKVVKFLEEWGILNVLQKVCSKTFLPQIIIIFSKTE
jgi:phosphoribosylformylglycinamidine (FGAM) synthase-like amidotransferase family enzyme